MRELRIVVEAELVVVCTGSAAGVGADPRRQLNHIRQRRSSPDLGSVKPKASAGGGDGGDGVLRYQQHRRPVCPLLVFISLSAVCARQEADLGLTL